MSEIQPRPHRGAVGFPFRQNEIADDDGAAFLPTPEQIRQGCEDIKSGRVVLSSQSEKRWRELRELKAATDAWDRGGTIEDDRCELPPWFGG